MPEPTKPDDQQTPKPGTAPGSELPAGENPPAASTTAGAGNGAGAQPKKGEKPDGLTPEIEAYLNSELAKARRTAEEAGKTKARTEIEREQASANATTEERLQTANTDLATARAEKVLAESQLAKLLMAIKVGLPDPANNWKRLIDTENEEALEADAVSLKESFGIQKPAPPPVTPSGRGGGRSTTDGTRSEVEAEKDTKIAAQAAQPMYAKL